MGRSGQYSLTTTLSRFLLQHPPIFSIHVDLLVDADRLLLFLIVSKFQKATKWSERKEAVAELTKLASTKKIAPGDFTEICRTLKKVYHSKLYLYIGEVCTFFAVY